MGASIARCRPRRPERRWLGISSPTGRENLPKGRREEAPFLFCCLGRACQSIGRDARLTQAYSRSKKCHHQGSRLHWPLSWERNWHRNLVHQRYNEAVRAQNCMQRCCSGARDHSMPEHTATAAVKDGPADGLPGVVLCRKGSRGPPHESWQKQNIPTPLGLEPRTLSTEG